jgi:hypothetical protein
MKTELTMIQPLPTGRPAIETARECYRKWEGLVTFEQDLQDYLATGLVWARPDVFAMAKVIYFRGEPAWFIRVAVGNIKELLRLMPIPLPWICFCRRGDPKLKAWRSKRVFELVYASHREAAIEEK